MAIEYAMFSGIDHGHFKRAETELSDLKTYCDLEFSSQIRASYYEFPDATEMSDEVWFDYWAELINWVSALTGIPSDELDNYCESDGNGAPFLRYQMP